MADVRLRTITPPPRPPSSNQSNNCTVQDLSLPYGAAELSETGGKGQDTKLKRLKRREEKGRDDATIRTRKHYFPYEDTYLCVLAYLLAPPLAVALPDVQQSSTRDFEVLRLALGTGLVVGRDHWVRDCFRVEGIELCT